MKKSLSGALSMLDSERMVVGVGFEGLMNVTSLFSTVRIAFWCAMDVIEETVHRNVSFPCYQSL